MIFLSGNLVSFCMVCMVTAGMVYLGTPQPEYLDWSKELDLFGSDHHTEYPLLPREKLHFPELGCFL